MLGCIRCLSIEEAWREGAHDDLVLSVALACWTAERYYESSEIKAHQDEIQGQLHDELEGIMGDFDL